MNAPSSPLLRISPADTVAIALRDLAAGERIGGLTIVSAVPAGHKTALTAHAPEEQVIKFGHSIGRTTRAIVAGEHVHTHNLRTDLRGELDYAPWEGRSRSCAPPSGPTARWRGYRRADGAVATRNEVWILPTVGCVAQLADQVARSARARHGDALDGIHAFQHPHGCSQLGDDLLGTRALLAGLATNPNAAGVLFLGLGCESNQIGDLLESLPPDTRAKTAFLTTQAVRDEEHAAATLVDGLVDRARGARREDLPLSALSLGLKCGGSDSLSGLTANPLFGRLTDRITAAGGRAILTEIPEIFGAEENLLSRAVSAQVFGSAARLINEFKRYFIDQGLPVSENPSPGNIAGGITTLEEKSLGAVQKGGSSPLSEVVRYGAQARLPGLALLEAPGNDAVSSTALVAAGATLLLFSTGRGTPLGFPVPTVKVASNRALAETKPHWIDFDASRVLEEGQDALDERFLQAVCDIASGGRCAAELRDQRSIAIWKRGATL